MSDGLRPYSRQELENAGSATQSYVFLRRMWLTAKAEQARADEAERYAAELEARIRIMKDAATEATEAARSLAAQVWHDTNASKYGWGPGGPNRHDEPGPSE